MNISGGTCTRSSSSKALSIAGEDTTRTFAESEVSVREHAAKKGARLVVPPRILDENSTRNYESILHFIDNLLFSLCIS